MLRQSTGRFGRPVTAAWSGASRGCACSHFLKTPFIACLGKGHSWWHWVHFQWYLILTHTLPCFSAAAALFYWFERCAWSTILGGEFEWRMCCMALHPLWCLEREPIVGGIPLDQKHSSGCCRNTLRRSALFDNSVVEMPYLPKCFLETYYWAIENESRRWTSKLWLALSLDFTTCLCLVFIKSALCRTLGVCWFHW